MLEPLVKSSYSIVEVLKKLDMKDNGGNRYTVKRKIKKFGLDYNHFTGKYHLLGKKALNRSPWQDILIKKTSLKKEDAFRLRRALIESGRPYECEICHLGPLWQNKEMRIHVDHKNGETNDNTPENLRFLCPNCHSQTPNFAGTRGFTDVDNVNRRYYVKVRQFHIPLYSEV